MPDRECVCYRDLDNPESEGYAARYGNPKAPPGATRDGATGIVKHGNVIVRGEPRNGQKVVISDFHYTGGDLLPGLATEAIRWAINELTAELREIEARSGDTPVANGDAE